MKKIFAIALALVMVLSMASAFATTCPNISWDCATYTCSTGTGKVELIPYVKGNTCGGVGYSFTPNTCAGAVNSEKVYFAVKVIVDADPSEDWWNKAEVSFSFKGLKDCAIDGVKLIGGKIAATEIVDAIKKENDGELKAGEYYLGYNKNEPSPAKWVVESAADFEATDATLFAAVVENATTAKACVKMTSKAVLTDYVEINGYKVKFQADKAGTGAYTLDIKKGTKAVEVYLNADEKIEQFSVYEGTKKWDTKTYNVAKDAFWTTSEEAKSFTCDEYAKFLKGVLDAFKFDFGTCITEKAVKANFGWDAKSEACFTWSDKVQAVVDAECVVAIPKTGDMSVLAWLF